MAIKTLKNLTAAEQRGRIFTRPDFRDWVSVLEKNRESLLAVDGRKTSQSELLDAAIGYTQRIGLPVSRLKADGDIIVTGHQPNWHHCGILAKTIATDTLARQTDGIAVQLVLDHDICDTSMYLPEVDNNGALRLRAVLLEQKQQDVPLELRAAASKEQLKQFIYSVTKVSTGSFCCEVWGGNWDIIIKNARLCESAADIVTLIQGQLNREIGLEIMYLPVSLVSQTSSFIDFVCSIIRDAAGFVRVYNKAIINKRQTCNLKANQTIRLLKTDSLNNIVELPFWLVSEFGKRDSLYVRGNERGLGIGTAEKLIDTTASSGDVKELFIRILKKNRYVIRPKAVTLTLFARLQMADIFVHGTGGENYEYITDHLIRNYYRINGAEFTVATATMTLPMGTNGDGSQRGPAREDRASKKVRNYREFFFGLFTRETLEKLLI